MRIFTVVALLAGALACGGSEPAPKPATPKVETPKAAEKAPEPVKEEPVEEAKPVGLDFATATDDQKLAFLMELGKTVYETGGSGGVACQTCHQANGEGLPPSFPPLKGAKEWMGDCATHAKHVINGLKGEIEVAGVKYNGVMPAQANLSDLEIAAVITFERQSWGNDYGLCVPADVAGAR